MGFIGFILKMFLKIAKPFLKEALIESITELISEYTGTEYSGEMTTYEFETMPLPDITTTTFDGIG